MIIQAPGLIRNLLLLISIFILFIIYYLINIGNKYVDSKNKIKIRNKKFLFTLMIFISIYIFYLLTRKYTILFDTMSIIAISIVIAYLLNPIVNMLEEQGIPRSLGISTIYLLIIGIILIVSFLVVPKSGKEIKRLLVILPIYFEKISQIIDNLYMKYYIHIGNKSPIIRSLEDVVFNNIANFENIIITRISGFFEGIILTFTKVISLVLIPIITFYFIKDKDYFVGKLYSIIPKKQRTEARELFTEIDNALGKFIRGKLLLALYVGIATTLLLVVLKIEFAVIIGILTGVVDIVPYFGPILGFIPAVIFAFLDSPIKALWAALLFIGIQWVENNVLAPIIIGESIGIHPITILLALVIGGGAFGVLGMIFSIPAIVILKTLFNFFMKKKGKRSLFD